MSKSNETTPNVPTLRFKGFDDDWNQYSFYKCVSIPNKMVDPTDEKYCDLPHIGAANIEKGTGQLLPYNTAKEDALISGKYLFFENDVIYSKVRPYFAKATLPKFAGLCSADAYPLHPNAEIITPYFLLQSILHNRFTKFTSSISKRTGMPKVNRDDLSFYQFYVPSIKEQKKINTFLNLIDKRIRVQNKIISKYETLIKGISCDYFSKQPNHIAKLKDLIIKGKAGGTPSSTVAEYYKGDIPFLSISDMTKQGKYVEFTEKHISENGLANSSAWIVPSNSLILSMYASVGLVCINKVPLATSQAMFSMMLKDCDMLDYIYYYLNFFRETQIHRLLETGTQSNINADTVRDIEIPFYSNILVFVKTLQAIENRLNNEKDMLSRLMNLKTYLLSSLFI